MKHPEHLFDAIRTISGPLSQDEVDLLNRAIEAANGGKEARAMAAGGARGVSIKGTLSIKKHEGCRLTAYPDPGSKQGHPWTIGYGATGPNIKKGVKWTQIEADARFKADLHRFEEQVERILGNTPTTQAQYDALVSFAYNVGIIQFKKSTLLRYHKQCKYFAAAKQFGRWIYNDGRKLEGLVNRRRDEAALYTGEA